jgi:hypothetical protein
VVTVHPDPERPRAWDDTKYTEEFAKLADRWNCLVVVGQGTLAEVAVTPSGHWFAKEHNPELFPGGGAQVGAPDFMFHEDRRKPVDYIALVEGRRASK